MSVEGLKNYLASQGFSTADIATVVEDFAQTLPWAMESLDPGSDSLAEDRFRELEAFFARHELDFDAFLGLDADSDEEWHQKYTALLMVVANYGKNDPMGEGDFWVVDDFYGTKELLIEVHQWKTLSSAFRGALKDFVRRTAPGYQIILRDGEGKRPDELIDA
jgi:hypothetical protein